MMKVYTHKTNQETNCSLAEGIEHLYLKMEDKVVFYMHNTTRKGDIEIVQIQVFPPNHFGSFEHSRFEEASKVNVAKVLQAEQDMITRILKEMRVKRLY